MKVQVYKETVYSGDFHRGTVHREKMPVRRGEITAYLSLTFILLVAFVGAMLESASLQNAKNYRRADMNRAMECVFAEYQKELLEEYEIFALEGSYETGNYSEQNMFDRLSYYGAGNMEQDILRIQFLTDHHCQTFYEQVAFYMEHKYGLEGVQDLLGKTDTWKQQEEDAKKYAKEEGKLQEELSGLLVENNGELPEEGNPIDHVNSLKNRSLLELVMPKEMFLSAKKISLSDMVSHRTLNQGYGDFSDVAEEAGARSKLLFGEYVMEYFTTATDEKKSGALDYQVEYILEGRASDKENLEAVAKKLLMFRFVSNYLYIQSDSERKAEAEALALTLCALLAVPAIAEATAQVILLAWAYGESVIDLRALLKGNKVPLVKSKESWQLQLSSLLTLGTEEDHCDGRDTEGGLKYEEYLRMLLFLESQEHSGERTLDLVEQNIQTEKGQTYFRADQCVSRVEIASICSFRRGITYRFSTYFGYQ